MDPFTLERQQTLRSVIRDEHLTCSICFCSFTSPKALPCLHTFCMDCLREYITGRNFEATGQFPCPMCRQTIQIPVGGVAGFPDNHLVASLSDTIETQSSKPAVPPRPAQEVVNTAHNQYRQVQPSHPTPSDPPPPYSAPSTAGACGDMLSPYEYVDKMGEVVGQTFSNTPNLYPQLYSDNYKDPCMKNVILCIGSFGAGVGDFRKPFDIAIGRNGEFVVSDHDGSRIFIFSNAGEKKMFMAKNCLVYGVVVNKDNQIMIVVNKAGSVILRVYSMQGQQLKQIGEYYGYDNGSGVTVTPSNFLAITNLAADNVLVFTDQLKSSVKFGRKGSGDSHFNQPQFIASTMKNYLVISDTGNHSIKICDLEGNCKRSFGGKGSEHGKLDTPLGVATDAEDNVIIADSNNYRVEIFNVKGGFITTLVQATNLIGPDVKPISVAVTPRNNVAVLLFGTGFSEVRIYRWRGFFASRYGQSTV